MSKLQTSSVRLFAGAYDLSVGGVSGAFGTSIKPHDTSDWTTTSPTFVLGPPTTTLTYSGLWDSSSGGNEEGLLAMLGGPSLVPVSLHLGLAVGAGAVLTQCRVTAYTSSGRTGQVVPLSGSFASDQAPEYGVVLGPKATTTSTADLSSVDNAAPSSEGGVWAYHVIAATASGGNARWVLRLQESSDDAASDAFVDLDSVNITAAGTARREWAGATERYLRLRVELDATSGSITYAAFLKRN